ncbi:MAG: hypothetical protein WC389_18190 [Lutibacter sp.]|jgi:hypothetical protein
MSNIIKSNYSKIPSRHSSFIQSIFPNLERFGIDLGNIEVKESYSYNNSFTLREKDKKSEYILFYTHLEDTFFLTKSTELTFLSKKSKVRLSWVKKHFLFQTKDVIELIDKITPFLNKNYNPLKVEL